MKNNEIITISKKELSRITLILSFIFAFFFGSLATAEFFINHQEVTLSVKRVLDIFSVYAPLCLIIFLLFSIALNLILGKKIKKI